MHGRILNRKGLIGQMKTLFLSVMPRDGPSFLLKHVALVSIATVLGDFLHFQIEGLQIGNGLQECVNFILPVLLILMGWNFKLEFFRCGTRCDTFLWMLLFNDTMNTERRVTLIRDEDFRM